MRGIDQHNIKRSDDRSQSFGLTGLSTFALIAGATGGSALLWLCIWSVV